MSISDILNSGANISITVSVSDLREWILELIAEQKQQALPIEDEVLLTAKETAKKLGVDESTLWRWDRSGYLKKIKIGNVIRYRESDILKIMEG